MSRLRFAFILSLLLLLQFSLFAQQAGSTEPEVELPELILSFEGTYSEDLPLLELTTEDVLQPGELEPLELLPELDMRSFDSPLPVPEYQTLPYASDSAPLFGRGYIGLGSANSLWGEVEIATLGSDPGFGLFYSHQSLDGFGAAAPGEGFTVRREEARGEADYSLFGGVLSFDGTFIEEERGLQQQSSFASSLYRDMGMELGYEISPDTGWFGSGNVAISGVYQNLSGTAPEDDTHLSLVPTVTGGYAWQKFRLSLGGEYALRTAAAGDAFQFAGASLTLEGDVNPRVGISAAAGAAYGSGNSPGVPFSLRGSFGLNDNLTMEASGGYYYRPGEYSSLLMEFPFLRLPSDPLGVEQGWEGDLSFRLRLGSGRYLSVGSGFINGDLYRSGADYEAGSHLLPVELADVTEISPRGRFDFSLGDAFSAGILSEMRYDYREAEFPAWDAGFSLQTGSPTAGGGFSLDAVVNFLSLESMPRLSASAWIEPLESVRFILQGEDLLAPLNSGGRIDDSGLELPGIILRLAAEISL